MISKVTNPVVGREGVETLDGRLGRGAPAARTAPIPPLVVLDLERPGIDGLAVRRTRPAADPARAPRRTWLVSGVS